MSSVSAPADASEVTVIKNSLLQVRETLNDCVPSGLIRLKLAGHDINVCTDGSHGIVCRVTL